MKMNKNYKEVWLMYVQQHLYSFCG